MTAHLFGMRLQTTPLNPLGELLGNDLAWISYEALCAQSDPEAWFPENKARSKDARKLCEGCPLIVPCAEYAAKHRPSGVWGGQFRDARGRLTDERVRLPQQRVAGPRITECGSVGGYRRHLKDNEPTCAPCREANNAAVRATRTRRDEDCA
ncbi:MAG: WhiB family transcriptional regulator [Actinomycetes bacterium]